MRCIASHTTQRRAPAACASRNRSRSRPTRCRPARPFARGFRIRVRCRGSRKTSRSSSSEPAQHRSHPNPRCSARSTWSARPLAGQPTTFSVTYELTIFGQYHPIDPAKVAPSQPTPRARAVPGRARAAHRVHRRLAQVLARGRRRRDAIPIASREKLFLAVDRIPWAGALEYSTIRNISDYALHAGHADCGQQTLLLMTLLRLNGIPARWQSGMVFSDGDYDNLHDWGWLYLAPYGWVPMDVTFGKLDAGDPQTSTCSISAGSTRIASPSTTTTASRSRRPSSTSAPKPSTCSAAKSSGAAATCISTSGTTPSRRTVMHCQQHRTLAIERAGRSHEQQNSESRDVRRDGDVAGCWRCRQRSRMPPAGDGSLVGASGRCRQQAAAPMRKSPCAIRNRIHPHREGRCGR